jgi:hypothetical protein
MGFEASRAALRFGYTSIKAWLGSEDAARFRQRFGTAPVARVSAVRYFSLPGRGKTQSP